MSRPVAAADAALVALCCEFHTITDLVGQADAGEVDIDDEALGSAIKRYYRVCQEIAGIDARTEEGRRAKIRVAFLAMCAIDQSAAPRCADMVRSALSDTIASWIWPDKVQS
jgi:hypothetical protein